MRAVLDTPVLLRMWLALPHARRTRATPAPDAPDAPDPSRALFEAWRAGCFLLVTSHLQLDELRRACRHPKIAPLLPAHRLETIFSTRHNTWVLENVRMPSLLFDAPDPADALLLQMTFLGCAQYLVTQRPAEPLQRHLVVSCHQVVSVEGMIATAIGTSAGHHAAPRMA